VPARSRHERFRHERFRHDHGTGILASCFGVLGLVLCLMLAVQVSSHLVATSRLRSDAQHAARQAGANPALQSTLSARLASSHPRATMIWTRTGERITLTVREPSPARWLGAGSLAGIDAVEATASAQIEVAP
jgi:hypothetical protein